MRARFAVMITGVLVASALVAGCGSSSDPSSASGYSEDLSTLVTRLGDAATGFSGTLLTASEPKDVATVRSVAQSQVRFMTKTLRRVSALDTPEDYAQATKDLRAAVLANRNYLAAVRKAASADPKQGLRAVPQARRLATTMIDNYKTFFRSAPDGITDGITDVGVADLRGLTAAQKAGLATAATPTPSPAPRAPVPTTGPGGSTWDVVANSGGEGVRYRYSPSMSDVVPGNGPFEGDTVSVSCFTGGEYVKGNDWWARLANGYYVPAAFLQYGGPSTASNNSPPAGAIYC